MKRLLIASLGLFIATHPLPPKIYYSQYLHYFRYQKNIQNNAIDAAKNGNIESLQYALAHGADITKPDSNGYLALVSAAFSNQLTTVRYIIEKYPETINLRDRNGNCALTAAIAWSNNVIAEYLLTKGALVDQPGFNNDSALCIACSIGNEKGVRLLLNNKADINFTTPGSLETPLHIAAQSRRSFIPFLCQQGAQKDSVNVCGETPLLCAIRNQASIEHIATLITPQNINSSSSNGITPLITAANKLDVLATAILLARGAHTDFKQGDAIKKLQIGTGMALTTDNKKRINIITQMISSAASTHQHYQLTISDNAQ